MDAETRTPIETPIEASLLQEAAEDYRATLHHLPVLPREAPRPECVFAATAACVQIKASLQELQRGQTRLEGRMDLMAADITGLKVQLAEGRGFFRGSKAIAAGLWAAVIGIAGLLLKLRAHSNGPP